VIPAGNVVACAGVDPEVAGSSVGNNCEVLGWGTNGNVSEVLSVLIVGNGDFFTI
jgi:hypothetical protein